MAPSTPPELPRQMKQATTSSRARFFDAFDSRPPGETVKNVVKSLQINFSSFSSKPRTCERWLRQRRLLGHSIAIHRQGKSHKKASKVLDLDLDTLLHASSKIRSLPLTEQLTFHGFFSTKRTFQIQLYKRRKARKFKKAFVRAVSLINQKKRVVYYKLYKKRRGFRGRGGIGSLP